jgi:curli biogenesis system outer membrane secretion channel CsgG
MSIMRSTDSTRTKIAPIILVCTLALTGCGKKTETKAVDSSIASSPTPSAVTAPLPDVGRIEHVTVSTQGIGATPDAAVQAALRLAIMEVNGESIDASSIAVKFGLDVAFGQTEESLRGSAFAEAVVARSKGTISNFKLVNLAEPTAAGQPYKANIEASIAKFAAPTDSKKIKIAVSPLHVSANAFDIAGNAVPASKVAEEIRQRLIDALTATGRFSVLDRDFGPEVQSELDLVASGQTPSVEIAKLSQTLSADIVWAGTINDFGYHRNARHLQTSDRDFVSYAGGWSVSYRVLNVSTRQIMLSDTLQDHLAPTEPTTMDRGIDGVQLTTKMASEIADQTVSAILSRTFPLVVVSREGSNVILSQGGQAVKVGASYAIVSMGKELKDPQTGASLGRTNTPCCDVVIDRISNKLAYGHLENVKISLDSMETVSLQVREKLKPQAIADTSVGAPSPQSPVAAVAMSPPKAQEVRTQLPVAPAPPSGSNSSDDSKKW